MPTIRMQNVAKDYGSGPPAVSELDLVVPDGAFMCLLGPSGCGKTTTLRMIAGLEHATAGTIAIGDRIVNGVGQGLFVPAEKRNVGLVFQSYALWPHLTVSENVAFGLKLRNVPSAERKKLIDQVLETLGIAALAGRYPSQLSGGQQQRVALARTLAVKPDVLLMDEPLSNLDARLRLEMRAELKRLHEEFGSTIVFVTHDQWEAMTLATDIAVMSEGRLQQVGSPDNIYSAPRNRFVAEFVGNPPINIIDCNRQSQFAEICTRLASGGHPAWAGIRPEALRIGRVNGSGPVVSAELTGILPTGGSWILETQCGGERLFAEIHEIPNHRLGDTVELTFAPAALHLFDETGARLSAADPYLQEQNAPVSCVDARVLG